MSVRNGRSWASPHRKAGLSSSATGGPEAARTTIQTAAVESPARVTSSRLVPGGIASNASPAGPNAPRAVPGCNATAARK